MKKVIDFPKRQAGPDSLPAAHSALIAWCFEHLKANLGSDDEIFELLVELAKADHEWSVALELLNEIEFADPRPVGWSDANRRCEEADDRIFAIEVKIASIHATTLDGLIAKARAARMPSYRSDEIGASIVEDLLLLG